MFHEKLLSPIIINHCTLLSVFGHDEERKSEKRSWTLERGGNLLGSFENFENL